MLVNFCNMIILPRAREEDNDSVAISAQFQLFCLLLKLNHEEQYTETVS